MTTTTATKTEHTALRVSFDFDRIRHPDLKTLARLVESLDHLISAAAPPKFRRHYIIQSRVTYISYASPLELVITLGGGMSAAFGGVALTKYVGMSLIEFVDRFARLKRDMEVYDAQSAAAQVLQTRLASASKTDRMRYGKRVQESPARRKETAELAEKAALALSLLETVQVEED